MNELGQEARAEERVSPLRDYSDRDRGFTRFGEDFEEIEEMETEDNNDTFQQFCQTEIEKTKQNDYEYDTDNA